MNIFDLRGPEFLQFYFTLLASAVAVGIIARFIIRAMPDLTVAEPRDLDAYDIAYLAGGKKRLADALLATLFARGLASITSTRRVEDSRFPTEPIFIRPKNS